MRGSSVQPTRSSLLHPAKSRLLKVRPLQREAALKRVPLRGAAEARDEETVQESHIADVGFVIAADSSRQ